jgi:hypothetical protein
MVVQKVQVPPWEAVDLGQSTIHPLGVKGSAASEEGLLVTKIADVMEFGTRYKWVLIKSRRTRGRVSSVRVSEK